MDDIILVPLTRISMEGYVEFFGDITPIGKVITDCLEGKEGLSREDMEEMMGIIFDSGLKNNIEEKLKRWIE